MSDTYPDSVHGYIGNLISGVIFASEADHIVYVTLETGILITAFNDRIPNTLRMPVWVGLDSGDMPTTVQVLEYWYSDSSTTGSDAVAYHHEQHEWPNGDAPWIRGEQFYPSGFYPVPGTLTVVILPGSYRTTTGWIMITVDTVLDFASSIPTGYNIACYALAVVDSSGHFTIRKGIEISMFTRPLDPNIDIPNPGSGDNCIFAVQLASRVTELRKNKNHTDFIDMRFTGANPGSTSAETVTTMGSLINGATAKTPLVDADLIPISDSSASFILKKVTWANVKTNLKTYLDTLYDLTATALAPAIHAATSKTPPVDADEIGIADSAASYAIKKLTWANLKATLKTYFDSLYAVVADLSPSLETLGGSASNGTATTAARSDHKHAIANPALDTLAAPTDITSRNASTSAHGLLPKLSGNNNQYLNGLGAWAIPEGTGGGGGGGGSFGLEPIDCSDQIDGITDHFAFTPATDLALVLINGLLQKPDDVTLDIDGLGVTLSFVPVSGDNLIILRAVVGVGDVYGAASVTDGNMAIFDVDGYHIKDGGPPGAGVPPAVKIYMASYFY